MRPTKTFDHERVSFNLARLKSHGHTFEVAVDPDKAVEYKQGKDLDASDVVQAEEVFSDVKKGLKASEEELLEAFGTTDPLIIAEKLLRDGEIQFTSEYRQGLRDAKRRKLVQLIHRTFVDPKTKLPHPTQRVENAFEEAKIKLDNFKRAEEQLNDVANQLRAILPLTTEVRTISVYIPANHAAKMYGLLQQHKITKEAWGNDGSLSAELEVSANLQADFNDELNEKTHGSVTITIIE